MADYKSKYKALKYMVKLREIQGGNDDGGDGLMPPKTTREELTDWMTDPYDMFYTFKKQLKTVDVDTILNLLTVGFVTNMPFLNNFTEYVGRDPLPADFATKAGKVFSDFFHDETTGQAKAAKRDEVYNRLKNMQVFTPIGAAIKGAIMNKLKPELHQ